MLRRFRVAPGVAISVKAAPSHESSSTGLKLQPLQTFDVDEQRQVGRQTFLHLADGSGWAFVFNRRTGTVVAEDQGSTPSASSSAARFRVAPGVVISVKAEPSHDSRSTGLQLQPLQEFVVMERRRVPNVRRDGGEQVFLRLEGDVGWAFIFNRRTGAVVATEADVSATAGQQHRSPQQQQTQQAQLVHCPGCHSVIAPPPGCVQCICPHCQQMMQIPEAPAPLPPQRNRGGREAEGAESEAGRRAARRAAMRRQERAAVDQHSSAVSCPHCANIILPPPGSDQCRCPHCSGVMALSSDTQRQALRAREQGGGGGGAEAGEAGTGTGGCGAGGAMSPDAQGDGAAAAGGATTSEATPLVDATRHSWIKHISVQTNRVRWLPRSKGKVRSAAFVAPAAGAAEATGTSAKAGAVAERGMEGGMEGGTVASFSIKDMKQLLAEGGISAADCIEREDLVRRLGEHGVAVEVASSSVGYVRRIGVGGCGDASSMTWVLASEGYSLVLPAEGSRAAAAPSPTYLRELKQLVGFDFEQKREWFVQSMGQLRLPPERGANQLTVRRAHLLEDAIAGFQALVRKGGSDELRKPLQVVFAGEEGLDAGGVAREFFHLVSKQLFNVDLGLFSFAGTDNVTYQINPQSGAANEDHLLWFRFAGQLLGRALLDGHVVEANLCLPLYRHILGAPLTLRELEFMDGDLFRSITQTLTMDAELIESLCVDFTTTVECFGEHRTVELKPGGGDIVVAATNVEEWAQLQLRYRCFDAIRVQLHALLSGIYSVVPQHLLFVFDCQELELLMCGLPEIDVAEWQRHTLYRGAYSASHQVVKWFWQAVEEFSAEERARLLQFVTGTSRVPSQGFGALQSHSGQVCPFTIVSISKSESILPRSHTCFNRIDLPMYSSHDELDRFVGMITHMDVTGFNME